MKRSLMTIGFLGLLSAIPAVCYSPSASASNSNVEAAFQNNGDLSIFYQAMLNTGVINELNEGENYTIFAPTNAAFAEISRSTYPCFYSAQCRPQIAAMLRNHIVVGHQDLAELASYGSGLQTTGPRRVRVEEAFAHDYRVNGEKILGKTWAGRSVVYRIDGVITTPQELAQFQTVPAYPVADAMTTEKTVVRKTYYNTPTSLSSATTIYPTGATPGAYSTANEDDLGDTTQTTTVTRTYTPQY